MGGIDDSSSEARGEGGTGATENRPPEEDCMVVDTVWSFGSCGDVFLHSSADLLERNHGGTRLEELGMLLVGPRRFARSISFRTAGQCRCMRRLRTILPW